MMARKSGFPVCDDCGNRFSRNDERALVSETLSICPLCRALNHGSKEWAISNDCNGPFEVFSRRSDALEVMKRDYPDIGCKVIPATLIYDQDLVNALYRHWEEDDAEKACLSPRRANVGSITSAATA